MTEAMNVEACEMPVYEGLENQLPDLKNFAIMAFENPGLYHIGENILNNLDIQTKLNGRLVRKSWNDMFEKQASKIDLENVPKLSKFLKEKKKWSLFLREPKAEVSTLVLNSYLQDLFNRIVGNNSEEFVHGTPLLAFARTGNSKIVAFILQMKIDIVEDDECYNALYYAAKYGHMNVAKLLKRVKNYPISYATQHGHLEVLKILMDDYPNSMNRDNIAHDAIRTAAYYGKIEVLKLFEERLNRNWFEEALFKRNAFGIGQTIFHNLAERGHLEMLKYLCQKAVFRNLIQKDSVGCTPIYYAAMRGHFEIVKLLAPYTSNPNIPNQDGDTPIHQAAFNGHLEIVKFLVSMASNPIIANKYGRTPIHFAAGEGHFEVLKLLALHTSNPNIADMNGVTPIHYAAYGGHMKIVKFLASNTSNPIVADIDGETPIHHAAEEGHLEVVKFLASYTSTPNSPNFKGLTPSKLARSNGFLDIAAFFLELETNKCTGSEKSFQKSSQDHQEK